MSGSFNCWMAEAAIVVVHGESIEGFFHLLGALDVMGECLSAVLCLLNLLNELFWLSSRACLSLQDLITPSVLHSWPNSGKVLATKNNSNNVKKN